MEGGVDLQNFGGELRGADKGASSKNEDLRMEMEEMERTRRGAETENDELEVSKYQDKNIADLGVVGDTPMQDATVSDGEPGAGPLDVLRAGSVNEMKGERTTLGCKGNVCDHERGGRICSVMSDDDSGEL